jgi:hypothetical protein
MSHQVYRYFDDQGRLIYVGQAICSISRSVTHRSNSPWFWRVRSWTIEVCESKADALRLEKTIVTSGASMFNIDGLASEEDKSRVRQALVDEIARPKEPCQPIPPPTFTGLLPTDPKELGWALIALKRQLESEADLVAKWHEEVEVVVTGLRSFVDEFERHFGLFPARFHLQLRRSMNSEKDSEAVR